MRPSILSVAACILAALAALVALEARASLREAQDALMALEIDYRAYREGSAQAWLPQTILYQIEGEEARITIETPMWPRESLDSWISRQDAALAAWRKSHGSTVDKLDR